LRSPRDLPPLLSAAWSSKHALKVLPVSLLAAFSVISVPLVEAPDDGGVFLEYLLPSAIAVPPALLALFLLWFFTFRNSAQPVGMLFLIASVAGGIRGASLYLAGEAFGPVDAELPSLTARVLTAVTTWNLTLASFAVINYLVLSPTEKWYELRRELLELDEEIKDSKLQLQWLINRKVKGLEQELRQEFLLLSNTMRLSSRSADTSYSELAKALRGFASKSVRDRSRQIWDGKKQETPLTTAAIQAVTNNPLVLGSTFIYLVGYLINEIRIYGFSLGLLAVGIGTLSFFLLLLLGRAVSIKLLGHLWVSILIAIIQGGLSAVLYSAMLPERTLNYALATALTASIWAMVSMFMAGWLKLSIDLYATELSELSKKRAHSETELAWLEAQLESSNREISKYLHGILQSRLMAHALSLDGKQDPAQQDVEKILLDMEQIMARPMDAFLEQRADLGIELERLSTRWQGFIEISYPELEICNEDSTETTIQVLQEALSNAFRHGGATRAKIQIADSMTSRHLIIEDNGQLQDGAAGLGSEILTSLTQGNWSIRQTAEGSILSATLQLAS